MTNTFHYNLKSAYDILVKIAATGQDSDLRAEKCNQINHFYNQKYCTRTADDPELYVTSEGNGRGTARGRQELLTRVRERFESDHPIFTSLECLVEPKHLLTKAGLKRSVYYQKPVDEEIPSRIHIDPNSSMANSEFLPEIGELPNSQLHGNFNNSVLNSRAADVLKRVDPQAYLHLYNASNNLTGNPRGYQEPPRLGHNDFNLSNLVVDSIDDFSQPRLTSSRIISEKTTRESLSVEHTINPQPDQQQPGLVTYAEMKVLVADITKEIRDARAETSRKVDGLQISSDAVTKEVNELKNSHLELKNENKKALENLKKETSKAMTDIAAKTASDLTELINKKVVDMEKIRDEILEKQKEHEKHLTEQIEIIAANQTEQKVKEGLDGINKQIKSMQDKLTELKGFKDVCEWDMKNSKQTSQSSTPRTTIAASHHPAATSATSPFGEEPKDPCQLYARKGAIHRMEISAFRNRGFLDIRLLNDQLTKTDENGQIKPNIDLIKAKLGASFEIVASKKNKNHQLCLTICLEAGTSYIDVAQRASHLIDQRAEKFRGDMAIDAYVPPYLKIDAALMALKQADLVHGWLITKKGGYCIYINDGKDDLRQEVTKNPKNFAVFRQFRDSCTRLFPESPMYFNNLKMNLENIEIEDLVALAKRTHYITEEGAVRPKCGVRFESGTK